MVTEQTTQPDLRSSLTSELRRQLRAEIDGADINSTKKFMLEQKFGLTDPYLTGEERQSVEAEGVALGR